MKKHSVLDALQQASKGLLFVSEANAKLEPFLWKDGSQASKANILKHAGAKADTSVETMDLDAFFRAVPNEHRPKFEKLLKVLKEQLSGALVFKLGDEPEKTVYVAGKTADGQLAGVKTTMVET